MESNNMGDYLKMFREVLHDAHKELDRDADSTRTLMKLLGTMTLSDGRLAQVQLTVTADTDQFLPDASKP